MLPATLQFLTCAVAADTGDDDGRYSIERSDVVNIDHPGKIGMVIGAITSGVGVSFLLLRGPPRLGGFSVSAAGAHPRPSDTGEGNRPAQRRCQDRGARAGGHA